MSDLGRRRSGWLRHVGVEDTAAQKNVTEKIAGHLKELAIATPLSVIAGGVTSVGLLIGSGIAAFGAAAAPGIGIALGTVGLTAAAKAWLDIRAARKESKEFEEKRQAGLDPGADPLEAAHTADTESKARDQHLTERLDEVAGAAYPKQETYTKAEVDQIVQPLQQQLNELRAVVAPLQNAVSEIGAGLTREQYARQVADGNIQADVARLDSDVAEAQARVTDTQAVTNDLTRGLNDVYGHLDDHGRAVNQHAGAISHLDLGLSQAMRIDSAHADSIDQLGRQQAAGDSRRGRRGDPAPTPPVRAARPQPIPPPMPGQPSSAATLPVEPWGAQQNQRPDPFPQAQRRQQPTRPGRGRPDNTPNGPRPGQGPRPPQP